VWLLLPKFVVAALMFVDLTTDNFFRLSTTANCPLPAFLLSVVIVTIVVIR
jgi:hypothetical protein